MFHFTKRLWLTSRPTEHFSVPTLQLGVKVAIEEPTIVRTSLTRHLFPEKSFITKVNFILFISYSVLSFMIFQRSTLLILFLIIQFNNMNSAYKKVLFAISLFHAAINERTTYAHCGWNQVRILLLLTIFLFMKLFFILIPK